MPKRKKEALVKETSIPKSIAKKDSDVKIVIPLKDLVSAYVEARDKLSELDKKYDEEAEPLKNAKSEIQAEIVKVFKDRKEFSARFEKATASLAVRKTAHVVDEKAAIEHLKALGLTDYVSEVLNDLFKETLAKEIAKGEKAIAGVEVRETEYLSVRTNDKDDARKITTEPFKQIERNHHAQR